MTKVLETQAQSQIATLLSEITNPKKALEFLKSLARLNESFRPEVINQEQLSDWTFCLERLRDYFLQLHLDWACKSGSEFEVECGKNANDLLERITERELSMMFYKVLTMVQSNLDESDVQEHKPMYQYMRKCEYLREFYLQLHLDWLQRGCPHGE